MSNFLRQLHIISSLKTAGSDDKIIPVCKLIAPVLTYDPSVRLMHTQVINHNLKLKIPDGSEVIETEKKPKRNLAIVLSWLLAKNKHVDKYCNIYMSRGFDVLTVNVTPQQMLFPVTGTQVVASNILDYLESNKQYDNVLIHAFSIGAYLMGEVFTKLQESQGKYGDFSKRVVGVILDSAVDVAGTPTGLSKAMTSNLLTFKAVQWYIKTHMAVMYNVATKHYLKASKNFHNTPLNCPALLLVSSSDSIGTPISNQKLADNWKAKGIEVSYKCWNNSGHVSHMQYNKEEYVEEIDNFLKKLNLK